MDTHDIILALDFGGTKLAAGLWDAYHEQFVTTDRCLSPVPLRAEASLMRMFDLTDGLLAAGTYEPVAVGASFDGPVDQITGRPIASYHVPGWEAIDLAAQIRDRYGVPCVVENDANAATLGEGLFGAGVGAQSLLYLTISTGIGGGLMFDGKLYYGAQGQAGEIGHMCLESDGPLCPCGRKGCLEALGAGPAIVRMYVEASRCKAGSHFTKADLTAEQISHLASQGDVLAEEAIRRAAGYVGQAVGSVLSLLNLERIVLGGGVTRAGDVYWDVLRTLAQDRAMPGIQVDIVPASLGGEAPMWGVCALARQGLGRAHG